MRRNFLQPPRGAAEVFADVLRALGVVSIAAAAIGWGWTEAGVMGLVLIGLVLPRFLAASAPLDIATCIALLVAGWSSVIDVYGAIAWWDLAVHFVTAGLLAAIAYLLLSSLGLVPDPDAAGTRLATVLVLSTSFGLAAGAVWEMLEWIGHTYVDSRIFVGYDDTIGDMALGGAGSLAVGFAIRYLPLRRPHRVGN